MDGDRVHCRAAAGASTVSGSCHSTAGADLVLDHLAEGVDVRSARYLVDHIDQSDGVADQLRQPGLRHWVGAVAHEAGVDDHCRLPGETVRPGDRERVFDAEAVRHFLALVLLAHPAILGHPLAGRDLLGESGRELRASGLRGSAHGEHLLGLGDPLGEQLDLILVLVEPVGELRELLARAQLLELLRDVGDVLEQLGMAGVVERDPLGELGNGVADHLEPLAHVGAERSHGGDRIARLGAFEAARGGLG